MPKKQKVLILGGEGFIGRNLSDLLSADYEVFSVGRTRSIFSGSRSCFIQLDPYKEKIRGNYDVIIQLIDRNIAFSDIEQTENKLLEQIVGLSPSQIILFSTAAVYMSPDSEYAKRKLLIEKIYHKYCEKNNLGLSIIRLFNVFGPYQLPNRQGSLVANIFYNYYNRIPIEINDLAARRDFIYSIDMAKCIELIIKNKIFTDDDLATNKMTLVQELLAKIELVLNDEVSIVNKHIVESKSCPYASSHIVRQIELTPMSESLKKTAAFYWKNFKLIKGVQDV